jgi:hypothetical protein
VIRRLMLLSAGAVVAVISFAVPAAEAATPRIAVDPNRVPRGTQVAVYGIGFCASPGCSAITITVDNRVAASGVAVKPDGSFAAAARISEPIGTYQVRARQTGPGGSTIQAVSQVSVAAGDQNQATTTTPKTAPPPPTTPPATTPGGGTTATTTTNTSPTNTIPTGSNTAPTGSATTGPTPPGATTSLAKQQAASTSAGHGSATWPWVLLGLLGLAAIAGAVTVMLRRR